MGEGTEASHSHFPSLPSPYLSISFAIVWSCMFDVPS